MILFREVGSLRFGSNKSLLFFGKVCTFYSRTDRLLSKAKVHGSDGGGGGWGGGREGGGYHLTVTLVLVLQTKNYGSLHVYFVVQIPLFID